MNLKQVRLWGREQLGPLVSSCEGNDVCALEVDVLLCDVLFFSRAELLSRLDRNISAEELKQFSRAISRRQLREPVSYITGTKEFFGLEFVVNPNVLIPRPETELLVEKTLGLFKQETESFLLVDVGTGSGNIVLSVLDELRKRFGADYLTQGRIIAVDVSSGALEVARENAKRLSLEDGIEFVCSNVLAECQLLTECALKVIVSNPPYVLAREVLQADVSEYEPELALRAGDEGLDIIKQLALEAARVLDSRGRLLMEIGYGQQPAVECLLASVGYSAVEFYRDLAGIPRVVEARK